MRYLLGSVLLVLLAALQYRLWFGVHGIQEIRALEQEVTRLEQANQVLASRNQALHAEVADLAGGGAAIEARARQELGLIKPGETFFRIIPSD